MMIMVMLAHNIDKLIMCDLFNVLLYNLVQVFENFSSCEVFDDLLDVILLLK